MQAPRPVDRIEITTLVDNVTDSLSTTPPFVTREWVRLQQKGMKRTAGGSLCCANHGLSLVITVEADGERRSVLFDGGPVDYAVERNGPRLGVDFGAIEAIVLSHGHWDHAGGIPKAIEMVRAANGGRTVPLHLHPGMFRERGGRQPDGGVMPMDRVPAPAEWAAMGADPQVSREPAVIAGHVLVSGEIPRVTDYEVGLPGQVARDSESAPWQPDEWLGDERFVAVHLRGKGLIVFSACSHCGIVNVLHEAKRLMPEIRLLAAMGGFHLSGINERIIPQTVADLGTFGLRWMFPSHCTGWRALNALERAYGEAVVVPGAVGKTFVLEA
ncbi:MBL fold metallo-hydrolase [Neoroseomonas oryzicola]|uniref:MBL fold metallo-hydrolase n=1 Tax=Neoroseomonas oryzicola TaxID=535904 RepID=A0A9X9WGV7_9PROT|nr:MBL fold metallo-hydrolase [Neoroseomonas oryzicola]MBR0659567.1 MBL fold metallo-hydrolase [Neoroseomonas oryzicola]NKE16154.1 MBL fold metallo-hydrolase [Neoroseomonas oryzicola]